jgi:hypothetical protein
MRPKFLKYVAVAALALMVGGIGIAEAADVLIIGRREDSTTFDPIMRTATGNTPRPGQDHRVARRARPLRVIGVRTASVPDR